VSGITKLSDAELMAALGKGGGLSSMSDADLMAALEQSSAAPEYDDTRAAGLTARTAVQAVPGAVAGLPALVGDYLRSRVYEPINTVGRLIGYGRPGLSDLVTGQTEQKPVIDYEGMRLSRALSDTGVAAADALNLHKPETSGERVAVAAGQTALESLGGVGLAKAGKAAMEHGPAAVKRVLDWLADAPAAQTAVGATAGGGAQIAAENDVNPLIGMGLGLAAGVVGTAAAKSIPGAVRSGRETVDRALLRTPEAQRQAAHDEIRGAAADPDKALRELDEGAGGELVPGSQPTAAQATGDLGLAGLERDLQTQNPAAFAQRRADQNSARLESLRSVQPEGDASEIVSFLRGQLDEIDAMSSRYEQAARSSAESAAAQFSPNDDAAGLGRTIRGSMVDAEKAARLRERDLWNAVDPDGTLTVPTQGAKDIADRIYNRLTQSAQLGLSSDEKAFVDLLRSFNPIESFKEFVDLSVQLKAAMRDELRTNGRTPAYARLTQLNQSVRSAMEGWAAERIAVDPRAQARIRSQLDEWRSGGPEGLGSVPSEARSVRAGGTAGVAGETGSQGSGSGIAARGAGGRRCGR
jgi:hypothetical protein